MTVTWLLVAILVQLYKDREQTGQKEMQNVQSDENRAQEKLTWAPRFVLKDR